MSLLRAAVKSEHLLVAVLLAVTAVFHGTAVWGKDTPELLRVALLPIPDVLPVYVAQEKGYFAENGIVVEPLPVGSAVERDQLMQAGRIDGMVNEISGAALFNRHSSEMKIVSYARIPMDNAPLFRVLAAPGSSLSGVKDLAGVPVAVSKNTVIEYITERLLARGGVDGREIITRSVPVLPERLQLLLGGQIKAATLPDPLGFSAVKAGAVEVVSDLAAQDLSASVISFSSKAVSEKKAAVGKFMEAWDRAAADLNGNPELYRDIMLKKIRVPKNVQKTFAIPQIPRGKVPTREQWDDAVEWLLEKKLLKKKVSYDDSVTDEFVVQ